MIVKYLFNKENRLTTSLSILYFIFGILFCFIPEFMKVNLETISCFLFLIYGGVMILAYSISSVVFKNRKIMISSIVSIILGILLLFIRSFFILILAFFILGIAVFKILVTKHASYCKNFNWYLWLILAVIYIVVGIFIIISFIINRFLLFSMVLLGVCLGLEAIANMFVLIRNALYEKEINENSDLKTEILNENKND